MLQKIKESLFTVHGLVTSVLHLLVIVGALSSYLFFRIEVLGESASMSFPSEYAMADKIRKH